MSQLRIVRVSPIEVALVASEGEWSVEDGFHLTPGLAVDSEIDFHVDNLIEKLEQCRRKAKQEIRKKIPFLPS